MTSIRENGMDEYWLQDYIWNNPSCLGLGDVQPIAKEKIQTSGGRLDILMKGSDKELYEIEVIGAEEHFVPDISVFVSQQTIHYDLRLIQ